MSNQTLIEFQEKKGHENEERAIFLPGFQSIQFLADARQPNLNFPNNGATIFFTTLCLLFELLANFSVLLWVKMKDRALVDTMVTADCIANLLCILVLMLAFPVRVYRNKLLCAAISFFRYTMVIVKRYCRLTFDLKAAIGCVPRLIPVTIVMYRYLMVCHAEFSHKMGERVLTRRLIHWTFIIPVVLSVIGLFFQDFLRDNLICNGREEVLWYNLDNFFGKTVGGKFFKSVFCNKSYNLSDDDLLLLNLSHPFKILTTLIGYAYVFLVPCGYLKIYTFLNRHGQAVPGQIYEVILRQKENFANEVWLSVSEKLTMIVCINPNLTGF